MSRCYLINTGYANVGYIPRCRRHTIEYQYLNWLSLLHLASTSKIQFSKTYTICLKDTVLKSRATINVEILQLLQKRARWNFSCVKHSHISTMRIQQNAHIFWYQLQRQSRGLKKKCRKVWSLWLAIMTYMYFFFLMQYMNLQSMVNCFELCNSTTHIIKWWVWWYA